MEIKSIRREKFAGFVYNIGIDIHHNYFANGILVHNCYQNSNANDAHYDNVLGKLRKLFDSIPREHLPYQIAYGGGEPTGHPDFIEVLKLTKEYGIVPNYTTNGMWIDNSVEEIQNLMKATKEYCGGVAVSCHEHLKNYWWAAAKCYDINDIRLNFHNIISDKKSIDRFLEIFDAWKDKVEYFVLLPYGAVGRAKPKEIDWDYLVKVFPIKEQNKIAFGANFYPYLQRGELDVKVSLYSPEIMSKYVDLKDDGYLYASSFSNNVLKSGFLK